MPFVITTERNIADRIDAQPYAAVLHRIGAVAAREEIEAYAVGGVVRDVFLGRATTDLDFVTVGSETGLRLAESVAEEVDGTTAHVYESFGTAAVRISSPVEDQAMMALEFVAARKESYRKDSRKPIVEDGTLADDLRRRDFTVNALAVHLHPARFGDLIDPFDGLEDLRKKVLRTPLDPGATFEDDPLRMIRAARFSAQLGFRIVRKTFEAMRQKAPRVDILSQERITDELQKIMAAPRPSTGFKILESTSIIERILPELHALKGVDEINGERHKDNFYHTLEVVDNLIELTEGCPTEETLWLRWAALLHDIAKPKSKRFSPDTSGWTFHGHEHKGARMVPEIFRRLKLPLDERMRYVKKLVYLHHRPVALTGDEVTDSAVRRLLFDAGDEIDDLMTLVRADITSNNPHRVRRYLAAFDRVEEKMRIVEEKDRLRKFQPPISGEEIMATLGIEEGVAVGIMKENIREAILDGEIPNEHDAAYAHMIQIKDEALRRGQLFEEMVRRLEGPERAALGAIKEVVFWGDLPTEHAAAVEHLLDVKDEALAERADSE